jgi:hypothetical protein
MVLGDLIGGEPKNGSYAVKFESHGSFPWQA